MYVESKVTSIFLCVSKLSLESAGYSLNVESYACQSSSQEKKKNQTQRL